MARRGVLGLHVVGCGYGECIVLEFPASPPAIVDCGNCKVADYAARFVQIELGWKELSFLAITHPHGDHTEGLGLLCDAFRGNCGGIWVFPGFSVGKVFDRFVRWAELVGARDDIDEDFFSRPVLREWRSLAEFATAENLVPEVMREWPNGVSLDDGVEIDCLLPHRSIADGFENALSDCAPQDDFLHDPASAKNLQLPTPPRANSASSALMVTWGQTRLLLCGDCERPSWNVWAEAGRNLTEPIHGMKIGHHGSNNGVFEPVLERLGDHSYAVVTPFNRGRKSLPQGEALRQYSARCSFLQLTAGGHSNEDLTRRRENAAGSLHALCSAIDEPNGIAAKLLNLVPRPNLHPNQVSLFFDKNGNCVDQHVGSLTERLHSADKTI
jgi:hypothetical protein